MHTPRLLLAASIASTLFAQDLALRGVVSNAAGKPVVGATLTLAGKGLKATSGPDGSYSFTSSSGVESSPLRRSEIALSEGVLSVVLREAAPVRIELFDAKGVLCKRIAEPLAMPGIHQFDLAEGERETRLLIARVAVGETTESFRFLPSGRARTLASTQSFDASARAAAVLDTLKVVANGYEPKAVPVSTYQGTLDVVLDSAKSTGPSAGCGKTATLKSGTITITSGTDKRQYILDVPANYDPNHPYRLVFGLHWMGGTMTDVATGQTVRPLNTWMYFGLKRLAGTSTIFVAPQGIGNGWANTNNRDLVFIDDILKQVKSGLCVDTTRMFAGGFSFGGGMSLALACDRPGVFRAIAPQSGSLSLSGCKDGSKPAAILAAAGTETYSSMLTAVQKFAKNNGCTVVTPPKPASGSMKHVCTDFTGCKSGYPARWCPFDAGHIAAPTDGQTSDNSEKTWLPGEVWKFYTQF